MNEKYELKKKLSESILQRMCQNEELPTLDCIRSEYELQLELPRFEI